MLGCGERWVALLELPDTLPVCGAPDRLFPVANSPSKACSAHFTTGSGGYHAAVDSAATLSMHSTVPPLAILCARLIVRDPVLFSSQG